MTDFVYALQNEDYWTPRACREWPADKQPRIWFSIPSAASAQEYRLHIATIKEECGMESDDLNAFFAQPAVRELWVKTCKQHITRIERFRKAGEGVDYDWEQMRDEARDQFLQSLGGSGTERFWALYDLTACIQSGMSEEEKKRSSGTSPFDSEPTTADATASSAAAPLTSTLSSGSAPSEN